MDPAIEQISFPFKQCKRKRNQETLKLAWYKKKNKPKQLQPVTFDKNEPNGLGNPESQVLL